MSTTPHENTLIERAVNGDAGATELLLLRHYDRLCSELTPLLPRDLKAVVTAADVLQEAYIVAFREIHTFIPRDPQAFHAWLRAIARHRLLDMVKAQRAAKRGGGRQAVRDAGNPAAASLAGLLAQLDIDGHTPSRSVAGHEAVAALQVGLSGLQPAYRTALTLRYIEQLPIAEIARRMDRSEPAVHALCHRGLERLRAALGRASQYFSRK
jgi:RNA polymerase sigma-70 factor (ECF subfamily)